MKTIIELITDEIKNVFTECGYDEAYAKVTVSNRPDLCEFQCNGAMAAAKAYKKAPFMIADEVVAKLTDNKMFSKIESVKPGFININICEDYLAGNLNEMSETEKFGYFNADKEKTVIVDYGGANAAKPLHVGHLRSAVIGESVKRINTFAGNKTIGDVHLGDWGLQMGLIIEELRDRKPELPYFDDSFTGEAPLGASEEQNAIEALGTASDAEAKHTLIEHNLRLVVYIAKKFDNTGVGVEDLISIGTIGLIKAINSYDKDKNIKLATYASRCIENEILMYLRRNSKIKAEVSIDEPLNVDWDGNELLLSDIIGTDEDIIYRDIETEVECKMLKKAINQLPERERIIVDLRFGLSSENGEEKTQKEVADMLGISQSYISRLEKKIMRQLRKEMVKSC